MKTRRRHRCTGRPRPLYYDTATADARQGSRQLAMTRKYALLTPVTVKDRIVYRETPFTGTAKPGDVLTVRLTAAGSPEWRYLAIEDPLPAGVEAIQDTTAYPLEKPAPDRGGGLARRVSRFAHGVLPGDASSAAATNTSYLVKVIAPGQFRAVPAQISPMYVPDVHASSEPQTMTVTCRQGARDDARAGFVYGVDSHRNAAFAALYWAFINTPESTIFMLALSLLLVIGMAVVRASPGAERSTAGRAAGRAARCGALWRRTGVRARRAVRACGVVDRRARSRLARRAQRQIGAWFIVTFNWSDVRPLLHGAHYAGEWLRVVVAPFAGLVWLGDVLSRGWRPIVIESA